jgi:hypothetical protein
MPALAKVMAIPPPIVPAPTTPAFLTRRAGSGVLNAWLPRRALTEEDVEHAFVCSV